MISLEKLKIFTPLQKLPKNVGGAIWANELLPKSLKSCPKSNKSANLITLVDNHFLKLLEKLTLEILINSNR